MKILSIKKKGNKQVYNLEMLGKDHNYLMPNGIVSANSHSVSYAYISYQTAWLKANHTCEYMAASISAEPDTDQQSIYMSDARRNNVQVLPPDINSSSKNFTIDNNGDILFGFSSIKGVGSIAINKLLSLQPFDSFGDFLIRSYHIKGINKRVIDAFINSGAFDGFGFKRSCLLLGFEKFIIDYVSQNLSEDQDYNHLNARDFIRKEDSYFISNIVEEYPILKILEMEKELLGVHISGNPFDVVGEIVKEEVYSLSHLDSVNFGAFYVLAQLNKIKFLNTKKGDPMAFIDIGDRSGDNINAIVFPNIFKSVKSCLVENKYILIYINVKNDFKGKSFLVAGIEDLTSRIDTVSEKIEEEKNMKSINIHFNNIPPIRSRGVFSKIYSYQSDEKTDYCTYIYINLYKISFLVKKIYVKKIDMPMIRELSRVSGLSIERGS